MRLKIGMKVAAARTFGVGTETGTLTALHGYLAQVTTEAGERFTTYYAYCKEV